MTIDHLLQRLDGVMQRGSRWSAKCPAHADKSPSLSIKEGERGILLCCFAGCQTWEICEAMGLRVADLFFDTHVAPKEKRKRDGERREQERRRIEEGLQIDLQREAEATIAAACGIDIGHWSDEHLDAALNGLADAYAILEMDNAQ